MEFKSQDVQRMFNISTETVRTWSNEFREYLSEGANPGTGRHRVFTYDDLTVLAMVSETKNRGGTYDDAHLALRGGFRGTVPDTDDHGLVLHKKTELAQLQEQVTALVHERDDALKERNQLQIELIKTQTRLEELQKRLNEVQAESASNIELHQEIAVLKYQLKQLQSKDDD